jgi:predicted flap endonuclease-1-like 5' DNA nuclease
VAPAAARPLRDVDPINPVRRANDQANLLVEPAFGPPDDLEQINGVGPILAGLLNDTGIYYFWQIAEWTPEEAAWVDSQLMYFKGRIKRDDWVAHARTLAASPAAAKRPAGSADRT